MSDQSNAEANMAAASNVEIPAAVPETQNEGTEATILGSDTMPMADFPVWDVPQIDDILDNPEDFLDGPIPPEEMFEDILEYRLEEEILQDLLRDWFQEMTSVWQQENLFSTLRLIMTLMICVIHCELHLR